MKIEITHEKCGGLLKADTSFSPCGFICNECGEKIYLKYSTEAFPVTEVTK